MYGLEIDPCMVLGITPGATLLKVRDAYRAKAKKYHPDQGGDAWILQIVTRCYEILSTARVVSHAAHDVRSSPPPSEPPSRPEPVRTAEQETDRLRSGVRDHWVDPVRMINVEVFMIRYEFANPADLLQLSPEDRSLCCCLNVSWHAPASDVAGLAAAPSILQLLEETFRTIPERTRALTSWSRSEEGRFHAWLNYPTASRAWESFRVLHQALNGCGLGVNQWTREMLIPQGER
jgi:hypothetical protein